MTAPMTFGIVGAGLIGQSWAALCLAFGHRVIAVDPRQDAAGELAAFAASAWPYLRALGFTAAAEPLAAQVSGDVESLGGVDFVLECGPERIEAKRDLVATLEEVIAPGTVIASSTSSLMASDIQAEARHPERILVGHPMNPPHLVPMVELVAGRLTAPEIVDRAEAVFRSLGRVPVRVRKEVPGHLANRLTAALYREAVHLVAEGIAGVEDVDRAIAAGPGLRWALMGPHLTYHLGGGAGGYRAYLDHLGPAQEARWATLGSPTLTPEIRDALVDGLDSELDGLDAATLSTRRDAALVALQQIKRDHGF